MAAKERLVNPVSSWQTAGMAKGTIVAELRAWRKAQGLTLAEAGARIIVDGKPTHRAMFHAWENGKKVPKDAWMFQIERVTGVEPNAFYRRPGAPAAIERAALPPRQAALI